MKETDIYDVAAYGAMIADETRIDAYREALRGVVTPDTAVLDLGTGTGICALMACTLGARRVYAIEPTHAIEIARQVARDNGFADRIEFIQELSTGVTLAARADVMVSDLRGVLPLFRHHLPAVIDARERLLSSDGTLIPQRDDLYVAAVEGADQYHRIVGPWAENGHGIDLRAAREVVVNRWRRIRVDREQLLTTPRLWAALQYAELADSNVEGSVRITTERSGTAHGLAMWFDTALDATTGFSNAPGDTELIYSQAFFPFPAPVELAVGDEVALRLRANLIGDDYVWRWTTTVRPGHGDEVRFDQSDFYGNPLSPEELRKQSGDHVPVPNRSARVDLDALRLMDGSSNLEQIATRLVELHPGTFRNPHEALNHIAALSRRYSE